MSKVFSFRLEDGNLRESQAIKVIESWISNGYSLRQLIVEALCQINQTSESDETLQKILTGIEILISRQGETPRSDDKSIGAEELSLSFVNSIKKAAKTGIRNE